MRSASKFRLLLLSSALALAACSQGSEIASPGASDSGTPPGGGGGGGGAAPGTVVPVSGTILTNTTFQSGVTYELEGRVDIGTDGGPTTASTGSGQLSAQAGTSVTLTIEPGAIIVGESGADHLVINRGSRIVAEGTASNPIVFTSKQDIARQTDSDPSNNDGGDAISEWGGLVILGRAPINRCRTAATPGTAQCENIVEGVTNPDALYGGNNPNDDSGILKYVQVRFAGFPLPTAGNELNGITFAGVGKNTIVDYVQVHNNADDGVEFFGGNVNVKHLVLTGNDDDNIDTDNGYQGNIQFVVVKQRANGGDNIVEASSSAPGVTPLSNATVANFSFLGRGGSGAGNPFRLNTGTVGRYINGVVKTPQACMRWESTAGDGVAGFNAANDPTFRSVLFDCAGGVNTSNSDVAAASASVNASGANNTVGLSSLAALFLPGANEAAVTPVNVAALDTFFSPASYIGAFSPTETEDANWATGWTFHLFPEPACPTGTTEVTETALSEKVCRLSGVITSDLRLTRGRRYQIEGRVDIGIDRGAAGTGGDAASLTIESGVTLYGDSGADHVVINRGSQIFSNGTATNPVVFTSLNDLRGAQADPTNAISEWGGLVILGRAPINRCRTAATPGTAACENIVEGVTNPDALYGGDNLDDNSGVVRYTQVKFAGFPLPTAGNELNGITFAGVGRGTTVDHIQVHNNADDGVEFFGGNVNVKHLVLTGNDDDNIDTDNGYQGAIQFVIVTQRSAGGDNIVEASSSAPGVTPLSNATVANFTFVGRSGTGVGNPFRLNTGTVGRYINGVVKTPQACMRWESTAGDGVAGFTAASDTNFTSVLFDCTGGVATSNSDTAAATASVNLAGANNLVGASSLSSVFINGATEAGRPAFDVTTLGSFFTPVTYIGAVRDSSDRWWAGWSCGLESTTPC
jgi:hypothetical protein